ncbi:MAG: hypothetical protein QM762_06615 [Chryseolinea sp.]
MVQATSSASDLADRLVVGVDDSADPVVGSVDSSLEHLVAGEAALAVSVRLARARIDDCRRGLGAVIDRRVSKSRTSSRSTIIGLLGWPQASSRTGAECSSKARDTASSNSATAGATQRALGYISDLVAVHGQDTVAGRGAG